MNPLDKGLTPSGGKAYQRNDREDRAWQYNQWMRSLRRLNGYFMDLDLIKFRMDVVMGWVPVAITDITRCDSEDKPNDNYFRAILDRIFERDAQGQILADTAKLLGIPAYLVVFQRDLLWLKVFSFQSREWKDYTPDGWEDKLRSL